MFLIRPKHFPYSGVIICAALVIMCGAVKRNHFLRLYTVAASNSILFAAFIPLALSLFMPVKFFSVPHTGSYCTASFSLHHFCFHRLLPCFGSFQFCFIYTMPYLFCFCFIRNAAFSYRTIFTMIMGSSRR